MTFQMTPFIMLDGQANKAMQFKVMIVYDSSNSATHLWLSLLGKATFIAPVYSLSSSNTRPIPFWHNYLLEQVQDSFTPMLSFFHLDVFSYIKLLQQFLKCFTYISIFI
ncbi:hypothetical protein JOD24_000837 [Kroppenstedtia sanguinis]